MLFGTEQKLGAAETYHRHVSPKIINIQTKPQPQEKIPVFASEASFREKWRRKEARSASSGERPYLFLQKE